MLLSPLPHSPAEGYCAWRSAFCDSQGSLVPTPLLKAIVEGSLAEGNWQH